MWGAVLLQFNIGFARKATFCQNVRINNLKSRIMIILHEKQIILSCFSCKMYVLVSKRKVFYLAKVVKMRVVGAVLQKKQHIC